MKGNDDLDEYEFDDEDFEDDEPVKEDEYGTDGDADAEPEDKED